MTDDVNVHQTTQESSAPRWVGLAVVILGIISIVSLGIGWSASSHSHDLAQTLGAQLQTAKQNEDVLSQRLAKTEETNAQVEGELSVVTDKLKLTQQDVSRARAQAKKIQASENLGYADLKADNCDGRGCLDSFRGGIS